MWLGNVFPLVFLAAVAPVLGFRVQNVVDIVGMSKDVVVSLDKVWDVVEGQIDRDMPHPLRDKGEERLFRKMNKLNIKLDELSADVKSVGDHTLATLMRTIPESMRLELRLNDLQDYITRVHISYSRMQHYVRAAHKYEQLTMEDFAKKMISHDMNSVVSLIERIHAFVSPQDEGYMNTGILELLAKTFEERLSTDVKIPELENVWSWEVVYGDLKGIYVLYETFRRFQHQQTAEGRIPSPQQAWLEMAETILYDAKRGVPATMDRIDDMVLKRGLFDAAAREASDIICGNQQPPQQILYNLFSTIAVTEIKGYSMIQFSYMLLKMYGKGNFTKESAISKMKFKERTNKTFDIAKNAMKQASREFWKCDPRKHVKGETYEELTELLQGYIINEVDMNGDNTCRENCGEYQYAKMYGCFKNLFCRQQRPCKGKILNCRYVDSDMEVCIAEQKTNRRYESIEYENGLVYGRKQACRNGVTKVDSWWRWLFWHCSYCMCVCDEQGRSSDRYFNLRPVLSDVNENKVVTGLRLVKKNRIIHLQIQQGTLEEFGTIDTNSLSWKEVDNYTISDRMVYSGKDYHIMTWEKRALDLDDLEADQNHVLTGVKFKEIGAHLNFEIHTTPFNYTTGKLDPSKSVWKDNPNTDASQKKPRSKVMMYNPDIPTRTPTPSIKLSRSDQFIEFTHTDFERDAAQTTVPFLDAQPVSLMKPVALSGAGLFYKGRINFGGFVTPKIIAYDYSEHLEPIFPEPALVDSDELVPLISVETLETPAPDEVKYQ